MLYKTLVYMDLSVFVSEICKIRFFAFFWKILDFFRLRRVSFVPSGT